MCSSEKSKLSISCLRRAHQRRKLSDRASSSDRSDHRQPEPPGGHLSNVDSRNPSLRTPLLSQSILLVPEGASLHHIHLRADCGGSTRSPNGIGDHRSSVLQGEKVGVHAESRALQHQRTRSDHHLRQLRRRQRLRDSYR